MNLTYGKPIGKLRKHRKASVNTLVYLMFTYRKSNRTFFKNILKADFTHEIYIVNKIKLSYIYVSSLVPSPDEIRRGLD